MPCTAAWLRWATAALFQNLRTLSKLKAFSRRINPWLCRDAKSIDSSVQRWVAKTHLWICKIIKHFCPSCWFCFFLPYILEADGFTCRSCHSAKAAVHCRPKGDRPLTNREFRGPNWPQLNLENLETQREHLHSTLCRGWNQSYDLKGGSPNYQTTFCCILYMTKDTAGVVWKPGFCFK